MNKRLNFLWDENISAMEEKLETEAGNYKDALDFAITQTLIPSPFIKPGPYLGIVLRKDEAENDTFSSILTLGTWISEDFGEGTPDGKRLPVPLNGYKVRIPELDAAIPEPPNTCATPQENDEHAQKWIEMHTTFISPADNQYKAEVGQIVWVDFEDYKTRNNPIFLRPHFGKNGEVQKVPSDDAVQSARAAYAKCAASLNGDPDGWSIASAVSKFSNYWSGDKGRNRHIGDNKEIGSEEKGSEMPKNSYPRECSLISGEAARLGIDNTPDNPTDEANLKYLEEEIIPVLLPMMQEVDSRFVVTSVYRSDELNKRLPNGGGAPNSWHTVGLAIDFGGIYADKDIRDGIYKKAMDHLKKNRNRVPWIKNILAELWRNHLHFEIYPPSKKSGRTTYKIWELKNKKAEAYVGK